MISGQGEAQARRYRKYIGKSGRTWFVSVQNHSADNIYVTNNAENTTSKKQGFEGFGGATLRMPIVCPYCDKMIYPEICPCGGHGYNETFLLRGGWHSNSEALFKDTDVDIRNKHRTFVVIARHRTYDEKFQTVLHEILYKDSEPQIGDFDRGKTLAQEWANKLHVPVIGHVISQGGGWTGPVYPQNDEIYTGNMRQTLFRYQSLHKLIDELKLHDAIYPIEEEQRINNEFLYREYPKTITLEVPFRTVQEIRNLLNTLKSLEDKWGFRYNPEHGD